MENLYEKIRKYPYVSFDLFDTLMFRTVPSPTDIFDLVEAAYNAKHSGQIHGYKNKRIKAEKQARKRNKYREIKIKDIYSCLKFPENQSECLMKLEKDTEIETCIQNQPMVDLLTACRRRGQQIIITTDMYLNRATITCILNKIGVKFNELFISCEEGKTKLSGELFDAVLNKLQIGADSICHIGDNPVTDIQRAREKGIQSFERIAFLPEVDLYLGKGFPSEIQLNEFIKKSWQGDDHFDAAERIGFSVVGPFVYAFCKWIHKKSEELKPNKLLFVAREGYLIKKAYDYMYPEDKDKSAYLRLNKNMMRRPALYLNPTVDQLLGMIPYRNSYTWKEICELLFIQDLETAEVALKSKGIDSLDAVVKRTELKNPDNAIIVNEILKLIKPNLKSQYELLKQYLFETGCGNKKSFLINNSINGSVQKILKSLDKELNIIGVQFLASINCKNLLGDDVLAWFDELGVAPYDKKLFGQYSIVLEHMLFEKSGTALYFSSRENAVNVVCEKLGDEEANYPLTEQIQKHAMEFIAKYTNWLNKDISNVAVEHVLELLLNPFKDDAILLGNIVDKDYGGRTKIADSTAYQSVSTKKLMSDIRDYDKVKWPHGLLKALGHNKEFIVFSKGKLIMYKLKSVRGGSTS